MPRKGPATRRPLPPDPIYQSQLVTQLINKVLLRGKRATSERIVYSALETARRKTGNDPVTTLKRAVENVKPVLETKSRRVGGATYQVPIEVRQGRATTLALRWIVQYSRARRERTMAERLSAELLDASNGDGAAAIFDAVGGVEPQSETVWRQADKYRVPRICFINKMDRVGAEFHRTVDMMVDRLGAHPAVVQLPWGVESQCHGVIDLVEMTGHYWPSEGMGEAWEDRPIPEEYAEIAEEWRHRLFEQLADHDEALMEKYVAEKEPSADELRRALRKATIANQVTPVLCGSAFKNKGVQPLLDAVVNYLLSPADVPPVTGHKPGDEGALIERRPEDTEPFAALAFKIMSDPYVGKLTYFRVYSGTLKAGSRVHNATKDRTERIGRLLQMHANHREDK